VEHRIGDTRIIRLTQKWLKAGVLDEGQRLDTLEGTPQGAVIWSSRHCWRISIFITYTISGSMRGVSGTRPATLLSSHTRTTRPSVSSIDQMRTDMAYARRYFFEVFEATKSPIAEQALRRIQALYRIEAEITGKSGGEPTADGGSAGRGRPHTSLVPPPGRLTVTMPQTGARSRSTPAPHQTNHQNLPFSVR
jgi:hypothetical protein